MERYALRAALEFYNVALTAQAESERVDAQTARDDRVAAALAKALIMRALMHDFPFDSAEILRPLLLNMYQCPLSAAEAKMLQAGDHQAIVRLVHYDSLSQVTPSGMLSLTVTV